MHFLSKNTFGETPIADLAQAFLQPLDEHARAADIKSRVIYLLIMVEDSSFSSHLPFHGKIALVTGSGRGIGRAVAFHLAQKGADVIINFFRNRKTAEDIASQIVSLGRKALVVKANLGDLKEIDFLFDEIQGAFGGLDIFVSNAASGYNRPAMEQKPKGWEWTMNINARSLLFATQRAVPLMITRGGGSIVSISSPGAQRVLPDYVVVGASKAALEALTRYLAVELSADNIVVNAVSPGVVETEALKHFDVLEEKGLIDKIAARTPAGRLTRPEDVAELVAFLCSPMASMIRGQTISIDGGFNLPMASVAAPDM
jgi:enoyl-[acyl-carrier protein] reductase III